LLNSSPKKDKMSKHVREEEARQDLAFDELLDDSLQVKE
jgi:hypothetical protein